MGSGSSRSASSSSTESQNASDLFSPTGINCVGDTSPQSPLNCRNGKLSPPQVKTGSTCFAVDESMNSNIASTLSRKMNLDNYRHHRTKLSATTVDHNSNSSIRPNWKENHRSETEPIQSESTVVTPNSALKLSSAHKSAAKPRMKLKIGSEIVVKTSFSPIKRSSDKMQNVICNGNSLPEQHSDNNVPNGDTSDKMNLLNVTSSQSSSCEEGSDSEPPSKHACMSFSQQSSSTADRSACRWIHHD